MHIRRSEGAGALAGDVDGVSKVFSWFSMIFPCFFETSWVFWRNDSFDLC